MQRLFDALKRTLQLFLEQRDQLTLLVLCPPEQTVYVLKTLNGIDEQESPDLFWTFTEPFTTADGYVDAVVRQFRLLFDPAREELARRGEQQWPSFPTELSATGLRPIDRLRTLVTFARSLLEPGQRLIWGLFPLEIRDADAYARFLEAFLPAAFPAPWCRTVRFICRGEPGDVHLTTALARTPRLGWYVPDLGREAMERSLEADAADEAVPLDRRIQALVQLAFLDQAHRRFPAAIEKLELALRYFQPLGIHVQVGLCLNGLGEVYERMDRLDQARRCFERAIEPAIASKAQPLLLNVTLNLANLSLRQRRLADAESYFDSGHRLARAQLMAPLAIQALERRGQCQYHQGRKGDAACSWREGAELARATKERKLLEPLLIALKGVWDELGNLEERRKVAAELAALQAQAGVSRAG